ncbi:hypothetical protein H8959_015734 [Pygathrix nigripes]
MPLSLLSPTEGVHLEVDFGSGNTSMHSRTPQRVRCSEGRGQILDVSCRQSEMEGKGGVREDTS